MLNKKQKKQISPFGNLVLDNYEKELEASIERGEWKPVRNFRNEKKTWAIAANHALNLRRSKKITVRVNEGDLIKLKAKAIRSNIPYQTLLGVMIRDFVNGHYSIKL